MSIQHLYSQKTFVPVSILQLQKAKKIAEIDPYSLERLKFNDKQFEFAVIVGRYIKKSIINGGNKIVIEIDDTTGILQAYSNDYEEKPWYHEYLANIETLQILKCILKPILFKATYAFSIMHLTTLKDSNFISSHYFDVINAWKQREAIQDKDEQPSGQVIQSVQRIQSDQTQSISSSVQKEQIQQYDTEKQLENQKEQSQLIQDKIMLTLAKSSHNREQLESKIQVDLQKILFRLENEMKIYQNEDGFYEIL